MNDSSKNTAARHNDIHAMAGAEWSMLLLLSIIWGGSFFFIAVALRVYEPFTVVAMRLAPAALVLWIAVLISGRRIPLSWSAWWPFFVMGMLNTAIPHSLIVWGQTEIESGLAAILNATTPLFTIVVAHLFTRDEKMSAGKIMGVTVGIAGVAVLIGPELLGGLTAGGLGRFAILGATLSYGFAAVFGRRFAGQAPMITAAGQLTCSSIVMVPFALIVETPLAQPFDWGAVAAVLALSLVSTAYAYVLYFKILAASGATNIALVTFLVPIGAIALGALFLDERLTWLTFAGFGLILLGLAAVDGRLFPRLLRKRPRAD